MKKEIKKKDVKKRNKINSKEMLNFGSVISKFIDFIDTNFGNVKSRITDDKVKYNINDDISISIENLTVAGLVIIYIWFGTTLIAISISNQMLTYRIYYKNIGVKDLLSQNVITYIVTDTSRDFVNSYKILNYNITNIQKYLSNIK
ncbi:MAG: hypothetical protein IJ890_05540 [Clostridia bacterium]|nr:hypothetical protein [Clostridia bacterium]